MLVRLLRALVDDRRLRGRRSYPPYSARLPVTPPVWPCAPHLARLGGASGTFPADPTIKRVDEHLRGFLLVRSYRPEVFQGIGKRGVLIEHSCAVVVTQTASLAVVSHEGGLPLWAKTPCRRARPRLTKKPHAAEARHSTGFRRTIPGAPNRREDGIHTA
jgi:hypothetical protein